MSSSHDEIASFYRGWGGQQAHPDSPTGGGGSGRFRPPGPLGARTSGLSGLPHPGSPCCRRLTPRELEELCLRYLKPPKADASLEVLLEKLTVHVPDVAQLGDCAKRFGINTALRLAHFLAQCSHESGGFKTVVENLNYSADGLRRTFPKYFPGKLAESYARKPEKIAARVYGGRMSNGNEASGDGYKYRGRGYIQLTGKDNYKAFGKAINEDVLNNPDLVSEKYPLLSAGWFWSAKSLNAVADKGPTDAVVQEVTKRVNNGKIGLTERIALFKKYYALC